MLVSVPKEGWAGACWRHFFAIRKADLEGPGAPIVKPLVEGGVGRDFVPLKMPTQVAYCRVRPRRDLHLPSPDDAFLSFTLSSPNMAIALFRIFEAKTPLLPVVVAVASDTKRTDRCLGCAAAADRMPPSIGDHVLDYTEAAFPVPVIVPVPVATRPSERWTQITPVR